MMKKALDLSRNCPPTNKAYSVGAIITNTENKIISTGYSREMANNVHAEEIAISKAEEKGLNLTGLTIYSTMEPCGLRLSGKLCCADIIIKSGISRVVYGIDEPPYFIKHADGVEKLKINGVRVEKVENKDILENITKINII